MSCIYIIEKKKKKNIYKSHELESTFTEIINPKKQIILGAVYRHTSVDLNEFNDKYVNIR